MTKRQPAQPRFGLDDRVGNLICSPEFLRAPNCRCIVKNPGGLPRFSRHDRRRIRRKAGVESFFFGGSQRMYPLRRGDGFQWVHPKIAAHCSRVARALEREAKRAAEKAPDGIGWAICRRIGWAHSF